jgi:uncharacterized repeat protein (TIGR01451 family)
LNTASVTCSPVGFPNTYTDSDGHSVNLFQPSINVVKTGPDYSKVDDTVTYQVTIMNTSSADTPNLSLVSFSDSLVAGATAPSTCDDLLPGESCSFSYDYTVLAEDDSGEVGAQLENTATAVYSPDGFPNEITDDDGSNTWSLTLLHPAFTLDKTCETPLVVAGENATFEVVFGNTGDVDLVVEFDEDLTGTGCPAAGVPVTVPDGESLTCTVMKAADMDPGESYVENEVNAHVTLPEWTGLDNEYDDSASDVCEIYGIKSGSKWHDMNGDHFWVGEPGLSGWTIALWDITEAPVKVMDMPTGDQGEYVFNMIEPGRTYVVCEVLELGWFQTYPESGYDCSTLDPSYGKWGYEITLVSGEIEDGNNFGNNQEIGCTLTQGYWKTHADPDNEKKYDDTWDKLSNGPDTEFFDTDYSWIEIFNTPPAGGNAYIILAHQWMAATLNSLKDDDPASLASVAAEMAQAEGLLTGYATTHNDLGVPYIPDDPDRATAIAIAETLDDFNNGLVGPPHCDD